MHLALTGFMGAGKTTVGRRLARILNLPLADSDEEIVRRHGEIRHIFEREGEARFREYERDVLKSIVAAAPSVIAVGGGAVLAPENRTLLRSGGVIVHLAISAEGAFARVAHRTHRPLLGEMPNVETIRALLRERAAAYADNDFEVQAARGTPDAIARTIAKWYRVRLENAAR